GISTRYWWGNRFKAGTASCKDCGGPWVRKSPPLVGSYPPNPYGLYDMNGSVWEWVDDCWHRSYSGAPRDGTPWQAKNCRVRVLRGGSWRNDSTYMYSAVRFKYDADVRYLVNGLRVAKTLKAK
ncbi:MAG: formylglycine-generating enzyme family protein, partial [Pseudomonadota bacterium]